MEAGIVWTSYSWRTFEMSILIARRLDKESMLEAAQTGRSNRCRTVMTDANGVLAAIDAVLLEGIIL